SVSIGIPLGDSHRAILDQDANKPHGRFAPKLRMRISFHFIDRSSAFERSFNRIWRAASSTSSSLCFSEEPTVLINDICVSNGLCQPRKGRAEWRKNSSAGPDGVPRVGARG